MRQRNGGTDSRHRLSNMDSQVVLSIHVHMFFRKSGKIHGVLGVHVDDVIGGGKDFRQNHDDSAQRV